MMRIQGKLYYEVAADATWKNACEKCHLHMTDACVVAFEGAAEAAFGGDCETRDVVYRESQNDAMKHTE